MRKTKHLATAFYTLFFLFLSGCDAYVSPEEYTIATNLCSNNNGIKLFVANTLTWPSVKCVNGAVFTDIGKE